MGPGDRNLEGSASVARRLRQTLKSIEEFYEGPIYCAQQVTLAVTTPSASPLKSLPVSAHVDEIQAAVCTR